jgi:hypothetical protein
MDPTPTLESIASVFPALTDQAIEENLVIFDSLLNVADPKYRAPAAELLRKAAESSQTPQRHERLLKAAAAIAAAEPCAFTPDGLSAKQAAEASTVTADQWIEPPPPAAPPVAAYEEDEDDEDEEEEEDGDEAFSDAPPHKLPHLPVRHFFRDLVVRVAHYFTDARGGKLQAGNTFKLLRSDCEEDGTFVLVPLAGPVRSIRLNPKQHAEIIENAGNSWFEPVPSKGCLEELCYWIEQDLTTAEDELDEDSDDYEDQLDDIDTLSSDVESCREWLERSGEKSDPPKPASAQTASEVFGRDHRATEWIRLLFAGIVVPQVTLDS